MFNTTKTIYNVMLETANMLGKPHVVLPNTTLNEKFQVVLPNTDINNPRMNYYCLGLDYEQLVDDDTLNIDNIRHKPTDGALFRHIPFVARKVINDLTASEKDRYRLRVKRFIAGEEYAFYFLKIIDEININTKLLYITNDSDDTFLSLFSTEVDHILMPTMEERDKVDDSIIDYIAYSQHSTITISDTELNEMHDACSLLYDITDITLGEIGLVTANEIIAPDGYKEVANAQMGYFLKINHMLEDINLNNKFTKIIELGGMSPLVFRTYKEE